MSLIVDLFLLESSNNPSTLLTVSLKYDEEPATDWSLSSTSHALLLKLKFLILSVNEVYLLFKFFSPDLLLLCE